MVLINNRTGRAEAVAERTGGHTWVVQSVNGDQPSVTTADRSDAVTAINDMATANAGRGVAIWEPIIKFNDELTPLRQLP
ncbi:hypothetical protein DQP57_00415 [Mycobacterium colombiense]|uniref:Uncharacterized protein n=2 Tax=Mycobacterium colombiense TaxID=339268 RepID=A0A329MD65_9MYCO|nr:hypothetical protein DQP57_00415 [Mycobacterium colombiense]